MYYKYNVDSGIEIVKSKWQRIAFGILGISAAAAMLLSAGASALPSQVIVTPSNTQGFSTADTRPGGAVNFISDSTAPGSPNKGALQLTTDGTNSSKAQYLRQENTPLANVTDLAYSTKQNSASFPSGDPSYQLVTCLSGIGTPTLTNPSGCNGFATFVYEPYWNGVVTPGVWQSWDVDAGQMWSSKTVTDGSCAVVKGAGGPPLYTLTALKAACPNAVVVGIGVNVGSYNPSYDTEADLVQFNNTVYNFEPYQVPSDKDSCKKDGWKNLADSNGNPFKNQGDCVSFVATNGKNQANG